MIAPRHGRDDGELGEAISARSRADTGSLIADRRNGRIVELAWVGERVAGSVDC
jgi:hypothetical protein